MKNNIIIVFGAEGASDSLECLCLGAGYQMLRLDDVEILQETIEEEFVKLLIFDFHTKVVSQTESLALLTGLRGAVQKPIIAMADRDNPMLRILALNAGADDVLDHSDSPMESLARIEAQIRCYKRLLANKEVFQRLKIKDLVIDDQAKMVQVKGKRVDLTPTEYKILRLLITRPGKVLSNKEIYKSIWNMEPIGAENTIAVHIRHIREKIEENPQEPRYLQVVWGQGYKVG